MANIYLQLLLSILIALIYGIAKFLKDSDLEHFNKALFVKTIVISIVVGYVQWQFGMTYEQALVWLSQNAVLMWFIDTIVNAILEWLGWAQPELKKKPGSVVDSAGRSGIPIR